MVSHLPDYSLYLFKPWVQWCLMWCHMVFLIAIPWVFCTYGLFLVLFELLLFLNKGFSFAAKTCLSVRGGCSTWSTHRADQWRCLLNALARGYRFALVLVDGRNIPKQCQCTPFLHRVWHRCNFRSSPKSVSWKRHWLIRVCQCLFHVACWSCLTH